MLAEVGYGLNLDHDVLNDVPLDPDALYEYRLEQGPVPAAAGGAALTLSGAELLAIGRGDLSVAGQPAGRQAAASLRPCPLPGRQGAENPGGTGLHAPLDGRCGSAAARMTPAMSTSLPTTCFSASTWTTWPPCARPGARAIRIPTQAALLAEQAGADSITVHLREDRPAHPGCRPADPPVAAADPYEPRAGGFPRDNRHRLPHRAPPIAAWSRSAVPSSPRKAASTCTRHFNAVARRLQQVPGPRNPGGPVHRRRRTADRGSSAHGRARHRAPHGRLCGCRTTSEQRGAELYRIASGRAPSPLRPASRSTPATGSTTTTSAPVAAIPEIVELNIGHAIVARALFTGLAAAVADMKQLMRDARRA